MEQSGGTPADGRLAAGMDESEQSSRRQERGPAAAPSMRSGSTSAAAPPAPPARARLGDSVDRSVCREAHDRDLPVGLFLIAREPGLLAGDPLPRGPAFVACERLWHFVPGSRSRRDRDARQGCGTTTGGRPSPRARPRSATRGLLRGRTSRRPCDAGRSWRRRWSGTAAAHRTSCCRCVGARTAPPASWRDRKLRSAAPSRLAYRAGSHRRSCHLPLSRARSTEHSLATLSVGGDRIPLHHAAGRVGTTGSVVPATSASSIARTCPSCRWRRGRGLDARGRRAVRRSAGSVPSTR